MVLLLALLSLVLIYLIDYEPNPCTIPDNLSYAFLFFFFAVRRHLKAKDSINCFLGRFELSPVPFIVRGEMPIALKGETYLNRAF